MILQKGWIKINDDYFNAKLITHVTYCSLNSLGKNESSAVTFTNGTTVKVKESVTNVMNKINDALSNNCDCDTKCRNEY